MQIIGGIDPYPMYNTKTFKDIWGNEDLFITDFSNSVFSDCLNDKSKRLLYGLLLARYANSPIANLDEGQFKGKLFSIAFQYGPTWERRLAIQSSLRSMSEDELLTGPKTVHNHASNPSTRPSNSSMAELNYIDDQNTSSYRKSKLDAYSQLWDLLDIDVTGGFIQRFSVCFKTFVSPENPTLYLEEDN